MPAPPRWRPAASPAKREVGSAARASRGPCSRTCPSSRTRMSSANANVASRCATMMPVRPASKPAQRRVHQPLGGGSSREDASSRITTSGSRRKMRAQASTWACPAESPAPPAPSRCPARAAAPAASRPGPSVVQHGTDAVVRHAVVEEGQVVAHAGVEEMHVLGDQADARAHRREADGPQIDTAQAHRTGRGS